MHPRFSQKPLLSLLSCICNHATLHLNYATLYFQLQHAAFTITPCCIFLYPCVR